MIIPFCLPEHISPHDFLQNYWQKRPLLIRQGLPQIIGLFEPEDILDLAQEEDVTARLIQCEDGQWSVKRSPLEAEDLQNLPAQWSVMVQNLEQWSTELDEYDVFLVQGYGERRWQVGKWCDPSTEFQPNQPIRIFDDMGDLVVDETMQPGDVLYIPSRMAHYGVSESDSLTFSFGLRFPNAADLLEKLTENLAQQQESAGVSEFHIPFRLSPNVQPNAQLDPKMVATLKRQLINLLQESDQFDSLFEQAVAKAVSSRRYEQLQEEEEYYPDEVQEVLESGGWVQQDANVKMLYTENPKRVYVNGEWIDELNEAEMNLLIRIANGDSVSWNKLASKAKDQEELELLLDTLCDWLDQGWLVLEEAE